MPLPAKVTWVTFDVYGTLIDWETGIHDAFQREASVRASPSGAGADLPALPRAGARDRERLLRALRRGAAPLRGRDRQGDRLAARALARGLPARLDAALAAVQGDNTQLTRFGKKFQTGLISNIDDKLLGETRRHIPHDFDLVVTAQQVRSYKPDPAHFTEFARRVGSKKNWVHICSGVHADLEPASRRRSRRSGSTATRKCSTRAPRSRPPRSSTLLEAAKLLGAA